MAGWGRARKLSSDYIVFSQGGCGNPILSALFFCSFTVIITMILLNLFTAVVLENFEIQEEQAEWTLTPAALEVQRHHCTHTLYRVCSQRQGM